MFASGSKKAKREFRARSYMSMFCVPAFFLSAWCFAQVQDIAPATETGNTSAGTFKTFEVTIKLEGKTVKGSPKVVEASGTFAAMFEKVKDSVPLKLEKAGKNTWRCNAIEGQEYVIGWIVKKGWFEKRSKMFGYCSEPFTAKEGLTVEFSPGMPATFEYDLRKPPKGVVAAPAEVLLLRETVKNGKKSFLSWGGKAEINKKGILKISGLASGTYQISARVKDQEKYLTTRTPFLYEDRVIEIKAGSANRFTPVYPEIDSTVEEGVVYVSSGDTSISLGEESLTKNAIVYADIVTGTKAMPIETGKPLQDIIIDWKDGKTGNISDFSGKTVVIDVWATWCAPCIRAFPEVNSIAEEFSNKNEIVFIALSIDYDKAIWEKTVNESSWNALKHGWLDRTKNLLMFGHPIPYTLIIDKKGIIRAAG
ncbi:MAG: thioredoxin-like domain-containing protein, partial [Sedimentisphaerales bacterium]